MMEILEKTTIFNGIKSEEIKKILTEIKYDIKKYEDKSSIVFRGDKVEGIKIILKGSVITEMLTADGNIRIIEELKKTDVLAAAFIFGDNNFYPVDLIAKNDVEIFSISSDEFLKLLSQDKKILRNFLNEISNKAQLLSKKIWSNLNNKTIKDKFNEFIREKHKGNQISIDSVKSLSEKFGVARPSLSRVLGEYIDKGILEKIGRNKYKILDFSLLED
ncbi:MAG: Crp/Fnr family transcriptional regulator [Fusobacterium sp.]|nr:Crp/Fnr family transcriptional regulator [Fusobacterium sp.]